MGLVGRGPGLKREYVGPEIADIPVRHQGIGGIGKDGKVMAAVRRDAVTQGARKIVFGPAADAVFGIGGDVGGIEIAERGLQPAPAGVHRPLAGLVGVALGAARGGEQVGAPLRGLGAEGGPGPGGDGDLADDGIGLAAGAHKLGFAPIDARFPKRRFPSGAGEGEPAG